MLIAEILPGAPIPDDLAGREARGICCDSRQAKPGDVFFAVPGTKSDGLAFAPQAARQGAAAIVAESRPAATIEGAPVVVVEDVRAALAAASARMFPRQPETVVAITGTSGKTSVAAFTRQLWAAQGFAAASLGTLGVNAPLGAVYGALTTP